MVHLKMYNIKNIKISLESAENAIRYAIESKDNKEKENLIEEAEKLLQIAKESLKKIKEID
jgi:type II secretory pathway component PulL